MLTAWIVAQASRVAPSPFSPEAEELIAKYAPPNPEAERQFRELALVVGYSLLVIPAVAIWGLVGWIVSSGERPSDGVVRIGWSVMVVLIAGLGLHLVRYYDALWSRHRARSPSGTAHRWPRASSDLDLLVQVALGVAALVLGAPG